MSKDEALKLALEALEDWDSPVALPAIYAIKEALAQPAPPFECRTEEEKTAFAFGWWKALETQRMAQPEQEVDWKDQYEKQKRRAEMWRAKLEEVVGPSPMVYPLAQPEQSWSWVCNECGAREFTSAVLEADLEYLACAGCGCNEFHKEKNT